MSDLRLLGFRSSPANGVWSTDPFAERWIAPNGDTSTSEYFGDQHYYNYVADSQNVETMMSPRYCRHLVLGIKSPLATCNSCTGAAVREHVVGRFSSEYGFQSMPSFFSIEKISLPEDWAWDSAFFKFRNHRTGDGQSEIANQLKVQRCHRLLQRLADVPLMPYVSVPPHSRVSQSSTSTGPIAAKA